MVTTTCGSRAASVASNGNARSTLKRRDKPYKIEEEKIMAKKRKVAYQTSYDKRAPKGFTFLPVGTSDLADLCKELSRKRSLPVHVVNAHPSSRHVLDPSKVSHHVHRIGYHFHSDVVEAACEQLGYVPYNGRFLTSVELQNQRNASLTAQIFAKHGLSYNQGKSGEESEEQVRSAIIELFPKIPQADLDHIVAHAWEKGTNRVGEARGIPLARRVQLAVIARIRHNYTDYDSLLKSFGDWLMARAEVEPDTLRKIIEWRGEQGDEDEDLEEIVRETIVLDDDDDDDGAPISISSGSDGSSDIEIVHRPAAEEDLRAERPDELNHKYLRHYQQPQKRTMAQRNDIARQMIQTARGQMQNKPAPTEYRQVPPPNGQPIYALPYGVPPQPPGGPLPPTRPVMVNGTWMEPVQPQAAAPRYHAEPELRDRPMPSIERDDYPAQAPPRYPFREPTVYRSRPATPPNVRPVNLSRMNDDALDSPGYPQPYTRAPLPQVYRGQPGTRGFYHGEVVDLTSPRRVYVEQPAHQPEVIRVLSGADGSYYAPAPQSSHDHPLPTERPLRPFRVEERDVHGRYSEPTVPEYDPNRPLLDDRVGYKTAASSRYASPAQLDRRQVEPISPYRAQPAEHPQVMYHGPVAGTQHPVQAYPMSVAQTRPVPAPIHGAPAPVQQMPRELARSQRSPRRSAHNTPVERVVLNGSKPWYTESPLSREHHPR